MGGQAGTLDAAFRAQSWLRTQVEAGLGAVSSKDAKLIAASERARVGDSVDLDQATMKQHPEMNRWDYLLSVPDVSQIVGMEPHAARDREIDVVIRKKQVAAVFLREHLRAGQRVTRWIWVTRSHVGFSRMDSARRRLAQHGIEFAGRELKSLG